MACLLNIESTINCPFCFTWVDARTLNTTHTCEGMDLYRAEQIKRREVKERSAQDALAVKSRTITRAEYERRQHERKTDRMKCPFCETTIYTRTYNGSHWKSCGGVFRGGYFAFRGGCDMMKRLNSEAPHWLRTRTLVNTPSPP